MKLNLTEIAINSVINVREALDNETIERYVESFDQLPPVVVFETDDTYLLADGFHRYEAAKKLRREEIEAEVKQGTRQDAEEYAALANLRHGKPLTRAERRKAVERMLKLHPERSDRWIAEDMGVDHKSVRIYREELESTGEIPQLNKLTGKDRKERPREVPHPKRPKPELVETQPQEIEEIPEMETKSQEAEKLESVPSYEPKLEEPEKARESQPQPTESEAEKELIDVKETEPKGRQEWLDDKEQEKIRAMLEITTDDEDDLFAMPAQAGEELWDDEAGEEVSLPSDFTAQWARITGGYEGLLEYQLPDIARELSKTIQGRREVDRLKGFFNALSAMMEKITDKTWWER
jgi:ParB-like chromosome segregation protein Spo0J